MSALLAGRAPFAAIAALALGAVGAALFTQHGLGMLPCPWCVLQRLIFVAIALSALPALLWPAAAVQQASAALMLLLAAGGAAAALWQHFVASASASCNLTLADRIMMGSGLDQLLPGVFAPWASCADAVVRLLGLHYEFWSLGLFVLIGATSAALLLRRAG